MGFAVLAVIGLLAALVWLQRAPPEGAGATARAIGAEEDARFGEPLETLVKRAEEYEATRLLEVERKGAEEINAARPFTKTAIRPAPPFRSQLVGADRERALSCLATAAIYEAGGDPDDQRPVIQVILNRVRHPAWPNAICDVVFQGSARRTGCQFSFTCDGSMARYRPSAAAFARARGVAAQMLGERVDPRVGLATHYHTDWVVPYWSDSLDKLTAVKTHLFFRWKGGWGTAPAFRERPARLERAIPALATRDPAHRSVGAEETDLALAPTEDFAAMEAPADGTALVPEPPAAAGPRALALETMPLAPGTSPGRWSLSAVERCGRQRECVIAGWADAARRPARFTPDALRASPPDLVYVQRLRDRTQQVYWNCDLWPRAGTGRCLGAPDSILATLAPVG